MRAAKRWRSGNACARLLAACLVLGAAARVWGGEEAMPILHVEEYRQTLVSLAGMLENGEGKRAASMIEGLSARPKELPDGYVDRLCEERHWPRKNLMFCGFAAYRAYLPAVHDVYVLSLTDRGPGLWVFRVFKPTVEGQKWYLHSARFEKDVGVLGGDYNPPQVVTGKTTNVLPATPPAETGK